MALTDIPSGRPWAALVLVVALLAPLSGAGTAHAAFRGENGKIAFVSGRDGNSEIYTMNADGSGQANISDSPSSDSGPTFSPDGQRIAFVSTRDGNSEIYTMNADGSGQANITNSAVADFQPAFSPDGQRVAFIRKPPPSGPQQGRTVEEIFTIALDGSDLTALTDDESDAAPTFSPDGEMLAFSRNIFRHHKIHTMAADGSNQTNISGDIAGSCGQFVDDVDPAFSPDGQRIAFASNREGLATCSFANFEIYTIAPDGSGVVRLTNDAAFDGDPDWQPLARSQDRPAPQPPPLPYPLPSIHPALLLGACANERRGTGGPDALIGTVAGDKLSGLGGNDSLAGLTGNDCLVGGAGNDIIRGASGNDVLTGGSGNDRLAGGSGNDRLAGGRGRNRYSAGKGRDTVNARNRRRERIDCGPGRDRATVDRSDRVTRCELVRRR